MSDISPKEVRDILAGFIEDTSGPYDWDDFVSVPIRDPKLEAIRRRCAGLREEFPPESQHEYCGAGGVEVIRRFIQELSE